MSTVAWASDLNGEFSEVYSDGWAQHPCHPPVAFRARKNGSKVVTEMVLDGETVSAGHDTVAAAASWIDSMMAQYWADRPYGECVSLPYEVCN